MLKINSCWFLRNGNTIRHVYDKRDLFASLIKIQIASIVTSVSFSVFTLYNKKSLWDGIRVELKEPEFELSG